MALRIIAYDDTNERLVRTDKDPADILSGSSTGGAIPDEVAAGSVTLTNDTTFVQVTFTNDMPSSSYALVLNFTNIADGTTLHQATIVTEKTASGFKAIWNTPLDSSNYLLDYIAIIPCSSFRADSFDLPNGTSTGLRSLLSANSFALCGQLGQPNGGGSSTSALIQTAVNTTSNTTQYEASWNQILASTSYDFDYIGLSATCPGLKSGIEILSSGSTQQIVNFAFPTLSSSSFAIVARFINTVDSSIIYQPITITLKSLTGFTAKWNMPLDSNNYSLSWVLHIAV